jgi:hypothetical protein
MCNGETQRRRPTAASSVCVRMAAGGMDYGMGWSEVRVKLGRRTAFAVSLLTVVLIGSGGLWLTWDVLRHPRKYSGIIARVNGFTVIRTSGLTLQRHRNDCGPVALHRILQLHGIEATLELLESRTMDGAKGTSVRCLKRVAESYGFSTRASRIQVSDIRKIPLPSLALYRNHHFFVVESIERGDTLIVFDPDIGLCRVNVTLFLRECDGAMLLIWQ